MKKILFVCMGNICRSAAAEAVMKKYVEDNGLSGEYYIDSAGIIGYHAGERADARMRAAGAKRGYSVDSISRQVWSGDFEKFDLIIAMDNSNVADLKSIYGKSIKNRAAAGDSAVAKICKLTDFSSEEFRNKYKMTEVPDPYYGGAQGFELVLDMLEDAMPFILGL